nr:uncharacterized protein LOC107446787 [Parasteatoda tepidariorum]
MRAFEISSLLYLIIFLSVLTLSESAKFKLAYKDSKHNRVKESQPVKRASLVQCAAHCLRREVDCDGFSLDLSKSCRLLKGDIVESGCPGAGCSDKKGYSVFKILSKH